MRIRQQERCRRIRIVCLQLPRDTGHRAEINRVGQAHSGYLRVRNRGHVGVANRIPDEAHNLDVPNATHIPITETNNTRNYT